MLDILFIQIFICFNCNWLHELNYFFLLLFFLILNLNKIFIKEKISSNEINIIYKNKIEVNISYLIYFNFKKWISLIFYEVIQL